MVWVVQGTLHSPAGVTVESIPNDTSHWLRPNRKYRVGRQGGLRAPPKPGSTKAPLATRDRLYDFRIASLKISKEGLIDFETRGEDWVPEDRPDNAANLKPYPLIATVRKKFKLTRGAGSEPVSLPLDQDGLCKVEVESGDYLELDYWHFKFTWLPVVLCFPTARIDQKSAVYAVAKSMGIKIAYGETLPHHTHYIVKKATPNQQFLTAAVRPLHIVSPSWFDALRLACKPPDRPNVPIPEVPQPQQDGEGDSAYDKRVQKYERELLAIDPDVGSDVPRWWGHSLLEKSWDAVWPPETDPRYFPAPWGTDEPGTWKRDVGRQTIFQNLLLVSFSGSHDTDEKNATIVRLGGGQFLASNALQRSPLPNDATELVELVNEYKTTNAVPDQAKLVILPPPNLFTDEIEGSLMQPEELDDQSLQQRDLLLDLQQELGATILSSDGSELATAIGSLDNSGLMGGASRAPKVRRVPSTAAPQSSAGFVDSTPPFPTGGVPGTHPDSFIPTASMLSNAGGAHRAGAGAGRSVAADNTQQSRADLLTQGQASSEAGPSSSSMRNAASTQAEPAPATTAGPKKLVRRARTGRTAVLDLLDDPADDPADDPERRSAASKGYQTQDYAAAGSQSAGSSSSRRGRATASPAVPDGQDENGVGGSLAAPPRTGRLARRAGQKSAVQAFLDDDGDAGMTGEGSGGASENRSAGGRNRAIKSKEERMREIREEDERRAKEEAERYEQRKAQEENEAQAGKGSRSRQRAAAPTAVAATAGKKRGKSAALSDDGGISDGHQPARKLASRKDGDAPVSTTSKRSRDMARAAQNSSSSDKGDRQARKKSKGPTAAGSPKSKKELAAQKKAAKEAEELDRKRLLQVKTSKRKGVEIDKELNEDFNALKIVKPVMKSMPPVDKHRMAWDEEDSDAERDRLIRADQEHAQRGASDDEEMDPSRWRQATQAMFVVRPMHIEPKPHRNENEPPHDDPRWAGKPNFKRFRPKNSGIARVQARDRQQIKLVLPEAVDFGLGEGYGDRKGGVMSQLQQEDEEEDADIFSFAGHAKGGQTKLAFGLKAATTGKKQASVKSNAANPKASKAKGKGKQVVVDSEEDSDKDSSHTLDGNNRAMDIDELDDEATPLPPSTALGNRSRSAPRVAAAANKGGAGGSRKTTTSTIMIDDSDSDSDSGLTFKGFGKKKAGATSARRKL